MYINKLFLSATKILYSTNIVMCGTKSTSVGIYQISQSCISTYCNVDEKYKKRSLEEKL